MSKKPAKVWQLRCRMCGKKFMSSRRTGTKYCSNTCGDRSRYNKKVRLKSQEWQNQMIASIKASKADQANIINYTSSLNYGDSPQECT